MALSLGCVASNAHWRTGPVPQGDSQSLPPQAQTLVTTPFPVEVDSAALGTIALAPTQVFEVVPDDRVERREFRVHTLGYTYMVGTDPSFETALLQWHSHGYAGRPEPHVHVHSNDHPLGRLAKFHVPTGRVSFESIIRFLIQDLEVVPAQSRWSETLEDCERRFVKHRTWSRRPR